jgi:hypothetical protein
MMPQAVPEAIDHDGPLVHKWRAAQLKRLGISEQLAEVYADRLDWHQAATLMRRGCPRRSPAASSADAAIKRREPDDYGHELA